MQIEVLRGDISHEQLSKRLGDVTERYLARYVARKVHLLERDFYQLAQAAYTWARSAGIDLIGDRSVPFKNDAKLVKNLYAGLRFCAERRFTELEMREYEEP
jgi:hypothetical protein